MVIMIIVVLIITISGITHSAVTAVATQTPPSQTIIHKEVVEYSIDWQSILPVIFTIVGIVAVIVLGRFLWKLFKIGDKLDDIRDDKYRRGAYELSLPGAGGACGLPFETLKALIILDGLKGRLCMLHDRKRTIVQRILFNPNPNTFPWEMTFDYNDKYNEDCDYDFSGCSYIILTRKERKKLAKFIKRSRYDSDGARFAINELKTCGILQEVADSEVVKSRKICQSALEEQGVIIERLMNLDNRQSNQYERNVTNELITSEPITSETIPSEPITLETITSDMVEDDGVVLVG